MTSNHAVNVHAPFLAGCSDVIRHNGCGHHLYPPSLRTIKYHNYHLSSLWDVFWHVCQTITNGICNNIWVFSTCFVMYVLLTLPFYDNFLHFCFSDFVWRTLRRGRHRSPRSRRAGGPGTSRDPQRKNESTTKERTERCGDVEVVTLVIDNMLICWYYFMIWYSIDEMADGCCSNKPTATTVSLRES